MNGDVATSASGSDALNFVFWFANEIVRLEEPHDSKADQHVDIGQGDYHWPMAEYEGVESVGLEIGGSS